MFVETNDEIFGFSNAALLDEEFDTLDTEYVSAAEYSFPDISRDFQQPHDGTL